MTVITTNILSMGAQANLKRANSSLATAMERLSSGMRVNGAKDDAAGQAIGNRMTSQISGRAMAQRNANDGVSMAQTAHGALDQINAKLHRIRELTVQGLNGTLQLRDNDAIQAEINHNLREVNRLADSVDYNGIPLLNGKAGLVDLQVGANDREMLGLDLRPPGFSVEALGLEDFTVAGIEGEVSHLEQVRGYAKEIDLYADSTAVTLNLGGQVFNHAGLVDADRAFMHQPGADGNYPRYVSDLSGSAPAFYYVDQYPNAYNQNLAQHDTENGTSSVQINGQLIYSDVAELSARPISSISFVDSAGDTLEGESYRLVHHDDQYLIEGNQGGVISYHAAELHADELEAVGGSGTFVAKQGAALDASAEYVLVGDSFDLDGVPYALDDYAAIELFLGSDDTPIAGSLVIRDGSYYARVADGAGGQVYRPLTSVDVDLTGGDAVLQVRVSDSEGYAGYDFTSHPTVLDLPAVDVEASTIQFMPADGDTFDGSDFRLVRRQAVAGQSISWMIEEKISDTEYRYHEANLGIELGSDGEIAQLTATALADQQPTRFDLSEDNRIDLVNGSSTVLIDPDNVRVNYTDANGVTFENVLRLSGDGNYYFDLPESTSNYGTYKIASLVNHDGEDILIKTINGNSEVIVYHTTNIGSGLNPDLIVETDANGPTDDGVSHTVINIREAGQEIRLKTPPNPLAALDRAIAYVDSKRSHLGAMENRLESLIENHINTNINLSAARSRILDADYAVEVANMTRAQILQQAGNSMLAQANVVPENVLALLE